MNKKTGATHKLTPPSFVVVITGGMASGKTTAAKLFEGFGAKVLDTDVFARKLTALNGKALPLIRQAFGNEFAPLKASEGAEGMNRKLMRDLVFRDSHAKKTLESILHPMIQMALCDALLSPPHASVTMVQIPLFVETGAKRIITAPQHLQIAPNNAIAIQVHRVLTVDCHENTQLMRALHSRQLTKSDANAMIKAQARRINRRMVADDMLNNNDNFAKLQLRVLWLYHEYVAQSRLTSLL